MRFLVEVVNKIALLARLLLLLLLLFSVLLPSLLLSSALLPEALLLAWKHNVEEVYKILQHVKSS